MLNGAKALFAFPWSSVSAQWCGDAMQVKDFHTLSRECERVHLELLLLVFILLPYIYEYGSHLSMRDFFTR